MPTYVAFLRAVNVGGRRYPMAELRETVAAAGFDDVATHIQTGNVRVTTSMRSKDKVAASLEKVFEADRGFAVPTVVFTLAELEQVLADAAVLPEPEVAHYVELMRSAPSTAATAVIEGQGIERQRAVVRGRVVHLLFDVSYGTSKPPSAAMRKAMGDSTNRNLKVIRAIVAAWGAGS